VAAVAAAAWPSGRLRVVVGGWGTAPRLALDAQDTGGVAEAVDSAAAEAGDQWASAEYRRAVAVTLARRAVERLQA
jgi:CO/xanthine dehydrogenase FAD-binding subunit